MHLPLPRSGFVQIAISLIETQAGPKDSKGIVCLRQPPSESDRQVDGQQGYGEPCEVTGQSAPHVRTPYRRVAESARNTAEWPNSTEHEASARYLEAAFF